MCEVLHAGYAHKSPDGPEILFCTCCGRYFRRDGKPFSSGDATIQSGTHSLRVSYPETTPEEVQSD